MELKRPYGKINTILPYGLKYDYLALNKSRISVNKTVFSSISSSGSSFFTKVFAILTNINSAIATIIKSIIDWINRPYLIPQIPNL